VSTLAEELERLYRRRYPAFRNALIAVTGSRDAARDAVQEAFARALRDQHSYRGDGPLEAWVWRIALRAGIEARRRRETSVAAVAETAALERERDPELADALMALPPRRRLIVFLRYFADLSYADIGRALAISPGTVAAALAQAHSDLSAALDREGAPR
jgi:RNA polymerase sigma-70 factor (ECF subfamily)